MTEGFDPFSGERARRRRTEDQSQETPQVLVLDAEEVRDESGPIWGGEAPNRDAPGCKPRGVVFLAGCRPISRERHPALLAQCRGDS